jgi:soluble lytic murein transglycosylase
MRRLALVAALLVAALSPASAGSRGWEKMRPQLVDLARSGPAGALQAYQSSLQVSGTDAWDARFLAGFIAFRMLNRADVAAQHFAEQAMLSKDAYGKSMAGFWLGRALAAVGRKDDAERAWAAAAQWTHTFYGQVAAARLGKGFTIATASAAAFSAMDVTEVLATGEGRRIAEAQAAGDVRARDAALLRLSGGSTKDMAIACAMAVRTGAVDIAVDIARQAGKRGIALVECGWPQVNPKWHDQRVPREWVLAVSREESTFKQNSVSSANAKGQMQVTDGAALEVGKRAGVAINLGMVRANADYNVAVGSFYLADQFQKFGQHPALALAAYNAGPGRVDEWLGRYGDPRTGAIDIVDWVELIPFEETRSYVKKVTASALVYMAQSQRASAK